jgi:signal transduction histidine kinase
MKPKPGSASPPGSPQASERLDSPPFGGPGLLGRAAPFALVAVAAEASLALPPGTHAWTAVTVSAVLLVAVGLAFLLPWDRLPGWAAVLVPLAYTGSALALTLAGGAVSGVGIVVLIPLIWTALFHRRWESACVVAAIVAAEIVVSVVQSAPDAVIVRRVLLWGALGGLLAVATHGLRDRIRRSQEAAARPQERIGELMIVQDRDRLAADLQSSVVQRIFAAGLKLQSVLSLSEEAEVRRRVKASVDDLDDSIRLLRQAIFGTEHRLDSLSLRQQVLRLCSGLSPVPEITFSGSVDGALLPQATDQLLDSLRMALDTVGTHAAQTSIDLRAGEALSVVVTGVDANSRSAQRDVAGHNLSLFRDRASQAGIAIEMAPVPGGTRLAWSIPLPRDSSARQAPRDGAPNRRQTADGR